LEESAKARKAENLASLTSYYEEIENELRKETPKTTQRKHRNIDGAPINNRYAAQNGGKDKHQAVQEQTEKPPLGPRRVYKYGWE
jgi:ABC-type metal ion transport system substrate-binding protein